MAKLNHSSTLSIGGRIASSWGASVGAIRSGSKAVSKEISGLKKEQAGVAAALRETESAAAKMGIAGSAGVAKLTTEQKKLHLQQGQVAAQLKIAQREAAKLGKDGSDHIDALVFKSEQLERKARAVEKALDAERKAAAKLGIEGSREVDKLRKSHAALGGALDAQRGKLKTIKAWHELDVGGRTTGALKRIGAGLYEVGRAGLYAGAALAATATAGVVWFTKSAIEATSSMEQLETALSTTEGSSANASKAMSWITKFAADTPYELGQVGEAYARLRAYGINPTDGTLRTLGDTASSMGKPLMTAVEAISDAVTGENERLKEFGIRASKAGNSITYFYKNAAGQDVKKKVKANSQDMIRSTLMAIWNEKYAGSMEKQSRTWAGLMSNLSDQWTQFQVRVMRGGVFDLIKGKAEELLVQVNKWADDGTLERWAQEIGSAYRWAFDRLREGFGWVRDNWPEIKRQFREGATVVKDVATWIYKVGKWASDAAGGPENLAKGIALLGAAKVLAPLGSLVSVGLDIVGWLSRAVGLTGALETGLGKVGGAIGGAAKKGGGKVGGVVGGAARGLGGVLGGSVATAGAGAVAGTIVAGAAIGAGIGMALDSGVEAVTGKKASTHLGEWMSGDVDARRAELLSHRTRNAKTLQGTSLRNATTGTSSSTSTSNSDNRVFNISIDAKGSSAAEIADELERKLKQSVAREELASYG